MKKKLLLTSALAMMLGATNAFAAADPGCTTGPCALTDVEAYDAITVSGDANATVGVDAAVAVISNGAVAFSDTSTLDMAAGSSITGAATIDFSGSSTLAMAADSSITGADTIAFSGTSTLNMAAGSSITGATTVTLNSSELMTLVGGTIDATGAISVEDAILAMSATSVLTSDAAINFTGTDTVVSIDASTITATDVNINATTIINSEGASTLDNVTSAGTINVLTGTLTLNATGITGGAVTVSAGATLAGEIATMSGGDIVIGGETAVIAANFTDNSAQLQIDGGDIISSTNFTGTFDDNTVGDLDITAAGTLTVDAASHFTTATKLTNAGTVTFDRNFTVGTYDGAGTVEVGAATVAFGNDTTITTAITTLDLDAATSVVNTTGTLDVTTLNVNNSLNLATALVSSGAETITTVNINGIGGTTTVGSTVTLGDDATFASLDLADNTAGNTLDIGANTLTLSGDMNNGENSVVKLNINSAANASIPDFGSVIVGGDLVNSTTAEAVAELQITVARGAVTSAVANATNTYTLFDVTGTAEPFITIAENARYDIVTDDNEIYKITLANTAADIVETEGGSANAARAADAWIDVAGFTAGSRAAAMADNLDALSQDASQAQAYITALNTLAPDVAPSNQSAMSGNVGQVMGAVGTRIGGGSTANKGMASGDMVVGKSAVWAQGLYNRSELKDRGAAKGFDNDTYGIAMGAEHNFTDSIKAGIGYAYTNSDINGFLRDNDIDTHTGFIYGEYKPGKWYVNSTLSYGFSETDETKNVAGTVVTGNYDTETLGAQFMGGYDFNVKGAKITPEAGLRYVNIQNNAYTDSVAQRVGDNSSDILTGVVGLNMSTEMKATPSVTVTPKLNMALTYDMHNDDGGAVVTLANGSSYNVTGEALKRFGMEAGTGVGFEFDNGMELSIDYNGKFREDYTDHTGMLTAKYKF